MHLKNVELEVEEQVRLVHVLMVEQVYQIQFQDLMFHTQVAAEVGQDVLVLLVPQVQVEQAVVEMVVKVLMDQMVLLIEVVEQVVLEENQVKEINKVELEVQE